MICRLSGFGFLLAFAIQAALLSYMLVARASVLANGEEVRLPVVPVDPRDFLRGDYVILSYPMSRLDAAALAGDDHFDYGAPVFVELASDGDVWTPIALHRTKPQGVTSIRGEIGGQRRPDGCDNQSCTVYDATYNLEKFFVPEGEGRELETTRNAERMSVDVAVGTDGRALLKRLRVDGEVRYEEKLF